MLEAIVEFPDEDDFSSKKEENSILIKIKELSNKIRHELEKRTKFRHFDNNFNVAIVGSQTRGNQVFLILCCALNAQLFTIRPAQLVMQYLSHYILTIFRLH